MEGAKQRDLKMITTYYLDELEKQIEDIKE